MYDTRILLGGYAVFVDDGLQRFWKIIRTTLNGGVSASRFYLGSFKNAVAVAHDTVYGDLHFSTFGGYAPILLDQWQAPILLANFSVTMLETLRTFRWLAPPGELSMGWCIYDASDNTLITADNWPVPMPMNSWGNTLDIIPALNDSRP